jgi:hypothetical protein
VFRRAIDSAIIAEIMAPKKAIIAAITIGNPDSPILIRSAFI